LIHFHFETLEKTKSFFFKKKDGKKMKKRKKRSCWTFNKAEQNFKAENEDNFKVLW